MNNKKIQVCPECRSHYCTECSNHKEWELFCSEKCCGKWYEKWLKDNVSGIEISQKEFDKVESED